MALLCGRLCNFSAVTAGKNVNAKKVWGRVNKNLERSLLADTYTMGYEYDLVIMYETVLLVFEVEQRRETTLYLGTMHLFANLLQ
jgi:hypothetical protein